VDDSRPAVTEREALARLCECLPVVRERAEQGSWSDDLQWLVDDVTAGGSAVAACRRLGLLGDGPPDDPDGAPRAEVPASGGARLPGLDRAVLTGQYGCPVGRCARRGRRGDDGRPPFCELTGAPMVFRADA
jgi:hypothetical protein